MTISLSSAPGVTLVERAVLSRVLEELSFNLTGLVEPDQAVKVGHLVGAQVLVAGRVFNSGDKTIMAARLIGVETSRVVGAMASGDADTDTAELALQLAERLEERLAAGAAQLLPAGCSTTAELATLKKKLAEQDRPTVAVVIPERHLTRITPLPDPAAATELKKLLIECGFQVREIEAKAIPQPKADGSPAEPGEWTKALRDVDVIITGEGISEFGARIGNMQSCSARVEISVIERKTARVLLAERVTARGVDLSENIAAKTALENAGRELGMRVLRYFAEQKR